jgi:hypothetical protein
MQPGGVPEAKKTEASGGRRGKNATQILPDAPTEAVKHL